MAASRAILPTMGLWLGLAACASAADPFAEDPPTVPPARSGRVVGTLRGAERVHELAAVSRSTGRTWQPAAFDRRTGAFHFENLPGDARYDLRLVLTDGSVIEGIDLDWVEARLVRLADQRRRQLGLSEQPEGAFTARDAASLLAYVRDLEDFADARRVLYVRGHGDTATLLVELIRTETFYAEQGDQVIWRMELWYFTRDGGGWQRQPNTERVLERHRVPARQWRRRTLVYDPALSVYLDADGRADPVAYTLPGTLDPARGRVAGSPMELRTEPVVTGIEAQAAPAAP